MNNLHIFADNPDFALSGALLVYEARVSADLRIILYSVLTVNKISKKYDRPVISLKSRAGLSEFWTNGHSWNRGTAV